MFVYLMLEINWFNVWRERDIIFKYICVLYKDFIFNRFVKFISFFDWIYVVLKKLLIFVRKDKFKLYVYGLLDINFFNRILFG